MVENYDWSNWLLWFYRSIDLINLKWSIYVTVLWFIGVHIHWQILELLPRSLFFCSAIYQWFWSFNYWSFMHFLLPSHSYWITRNYVCDFAFMLWNFIFDILRTSRALHLLRKYLSTLNSWRSFWNLVKFVFSQCWI